MKFKKYIDDISPYVPGKPIDEVKEELGLDSIIKLASNENPLGVSNFVKDAIIKELNSYNIYPDGACWKLKRKLADYHNIDTAEIIVGNGSNEIIEFVAKGFIQSGDEVISSQYSFLVYPLLTKVSDAKFIEVKARLDYSYDLEAILNAVTTNTKVIFLANPNNPTGTIFLKNEFEYFMNAISKNIIVCLDEAYFDFVDNQAYPNGIDYFHKYSNLIVLRTFSKAFGLAGFRIGYGVASKSIISYFDKLRQPFNVNAVAQVAACAVLDDCDYLNRSKAIVKKGKQYLYKEIDRLNMFYIKSYTNFILVNVGKDSKEVFQTALNSGVIIRDMKAYGLDNFIRITIGKEDENKKLIEVLNNIGS